MREINIIVYFYTQTVVHLSAGEGASGWNDRTFIDAKKEETWHIKVVAAGSVEPPERCTRRLAQSVRKSAKFLLNPEKTVLCTVRIVFLSVRMQAVKRGRSYKVLSFR